MQAIKRFIPRSPIRILRAVYHFGIRYQCPFCNHSTRHVAPIGFEFSVLREKQVIGGGIRNGGCYVCGSTDRERLVYAYLKDYLRILHTTTGMMILHVAPERNLQSFLKKHFNSAYITGDKFTGGYAYAPDTMYLDITELPFQDNVFDVIICNHVLEHIVADSFAIKELCRVLKAGGQAILQVPISKNSNDTYEDFTVTEPADREKLFGQSDHVRIYGQDYAGRLRKGGFRVNRINISAQYPRYALNPDEDLYIGTK